MTRHGSVNPLTVNQIVMEPFDMKIKVHILRVVVVCWKSDPVQRAVKSPSLVIVVWVIDANGTRVGAIALFSAVKDTSRAVE